MRASVGLNLGGGTDTTVYKFGGTGISEVWGDGYARKCKWAYRQAPVKTSREWMREKATILKVMNSDGLLINYWHDGWS